MSSVHSEPHLAGLALHKSSQHPYTPSEDTKFGEGYKTITSRVISRNDSPSLRELDRNDNILQVDLGPQFEIDGTEFDVIFELDSVSPLSPFSDDQDDSDQSVSCETSEHHFPAFGSLTSLIDLDGYELDFAFDEARSFAENPRNHPPRSLYTSDQFVIIPSSMSDGHGPYTGTKGEDLSDLSTGDVVFDLFFQDLQRAIPGDVLFEFDAACLKELDARLLLAPGEAFDDVCWAEISQPHDASRWKPLPDVPSGLVENGYGAAEIWHMEHDHWAETSSSSNLQCSAELMEGPDTDWHPFAMSDGH